MMERRSLLRSAVAGLFPLFFKVVTPAPKPKPITGVCPLCRGACAKQIETEFYSNTGLINRGEPVFRSKPLTQDEFEMYRQAFLADFFRDGL